MLLADGEDERGLVVLRLVGDGESVRRARRARGGDGRHVDGITPATQIQSILEGLHIFLLIQDPCLGK